jgi:hypothetical protein
MQEKSENYSEFSERTERLALQLGSLLSDLPGKIGVSPSMFHAYRSGKHAISEKAWRKLNAAEQMAGIIESKGRSESPSIVVDIERNYRKEDPQSSPIQETDAERIKRLELSLATLTDTVERLARLLEKALSQGKDEI